METYYEADLELRQPLTDTDAFLDGARYNDEGDLELLRSYLALHPHDVDARDEQGRTAMHMAAANGHVEIMEMLFEFSPQPNVPNHEGNTALHFAALNNRVTAAQKLLQRGWSVSFQNAFEKTPLQLIYDKRYEEMETLLMGHDDSLDTYEPPAEAVFTADDMGELEDEAKTSSHDTSATPTTGQITSVAKDSSEKRAGGQDSTVEGYRPSNAALFGSSNIDDVE